MEPGNSTKEFGESGRAPTGKKSSMGGEISWTEKASTLKKWGGEKLVKATSRNRAKNGKNAWARRKRRGH